MFVQSMRLIMALCNFIQIFIKCMSACIHRCRLVSTTCCFVLSISATNGLTEREAAISERKLGVFYASQIREEWVESPWLMYPVPHVTEETERIDAYHQPDHYAFINTAWALMSMKVGMVPEEYHKPVAAAIKRFWEVRPEGYDHLYGLQDFVSEQCGIEKGGNLMMARTRPPQRQQMTVRHRLLKTISLMHDFQQVLLETADRTKDAVMPGYTHIRHAQPTTLGHYLMSIYDPIDRSMAMVEQGYKAMSLNELGCGALAGTSWPIDRELVSEYLGLEGLLENTNDAVAYSDGYVQLVAALSNNMTVMSRMGLEMEFWSTLEYGFLDFKIGAGSFMMPNKRSNQTYLENTAVGAARIVGALTEAASMGIRIPHGDMQTMAYNMESSSLAALHSLEKHIRPYLYHFPTMKVYREVMLERAREGYSCSTELANELTRRYRIDYRTSHQVVNRFVKESAVRGVPASEANLALLVEATQEITGKSIDLTQAELRKILDPIHFVEVTNSRGGVSPDEVSRMIQDRFQKLESARARQQDRIKKLEMGKQQMFDDLEEFLK